MHPKRPIFHPLMGTIKRGQRVLWNLVPSSCSVPSDRVTLSATGSGKLHYGTFGFGGSDDGFGLQDQRGMTLSEPSVSRTTEMTSAMSVWPL